MNLSLARQSFPVTRKWNYLNHASVSPLPTYVREAMMSFHEERETDGGLSYAEWFDRVEASRDHIGKLINSPGEQIAFFSSTSHALNSVADMLPLNQGDEVVVTDLEFPSNAFPWVRLQKRGIRVAWARSHKGILNPADVEKTLGDRTRAIAISHVCYYNGFRADLESIAEIGRKHGVAVVVDAMQSIGALQIDVGKLNLDFVASNSYKWLLGPFGVAMLYCRDDWVTKLEAASVGWYSVKDIWSREIEKFELATGARRFEVGHPYFAGILGLDAAVEFLLQIGPERIERRVLSLTRKIREGLGLYDNVRILSPTEGISGITLLKIDGKDPRFVVDALRERGIVVFCQSWKNGIGVKVSPHFYNTEDEVDAFVDAVGSLAG